MSVILYAQYSYPLTQCVYYISVLCICGVLLDTIELRTAFFVEIKLNHSHTFKASVTGQWFTYIKVCVLFSILPSPPSFSLPPFSSTI